MSSDLKNGESAGSYARHCLERGEFAQAERAARTLLADHPHDRDGLYLLAVAQRLQGQLDGALETLDALEVYHPQYPRLYQERGHCRVLQRRADDAIDAFEHAVHLNPALPASWRTLASLYRMCGRSADAANAAAHVAKLASLPADIVTARSMFADGETEAAELLVRQYLRTHGDHVEGMRLLAQIGLKLDVLDDAEVLLESVLALEPGYAAARFDYLQVLMQRHKHRLAREQLAILLQEEPDNRAYRTAQATLSTELGECEQALRLYGALLQEMPEHPELHLSVGHTLKTLGRQG